MTTRTSTLAALAGAAAATKGAGSGAPTLEYHTQGDTVTLTNGTATYAPFGAAADVATLMESATIGGTYATADAASLADAHGDVGTFTQADAVALADSATFGAQIAAVNDAVSLADAHTDVGTFARADSAALAEAVTVLTGFGSAGELIALAESYTFGASTDPTADTTSMGDSYSYTATVTAADAMAFADAHTDVGNYAQNDGASLADAQVGNGTATVADAASLAEANSYAMNFTAADAASLADAHVDSGTVSRTETVSMAESASWLGTWLRADTASLAESATWVGKITAADTVSLAEAHTDSGRFTQADTTALAEANSYVTSGGSGDPDFASRTVVLPLNGNRTDAKGGTWTADGTPVYSATNPPFTGLQSLVMTGGANYPISPTGKGNFGTGTFGVEILVRTTNLAATWRAIIGNYGLAASWNIWMTDLGQLYFDAGDGTAAVDGASGPDIRDGAWWYITVGRNSSNRISLRSGKIGTDSVTTERAFITSTKSFNVNDSLRVGVEGSYNGSPWDGNIAQLRVGTVFPGTSVPTAAWPLS